MLLNLTIVGLAISLMANLALIPAYISAKEDLATVNVKLDTATTAAKSCSDSVAEMSTKAQDQATAALKAVAAAQGRARVLEEAARAELTRSQAVPGDACRSAQVETNEWLTKRREP